MALTLALKEAVKLTGKVIRKGFDRISFLEKKS